MPFASMGRRRWLQAALASAGATLALPRAMADPAAVTPVRQLCDSLLGIMKAGHATPFPTALRRRWPRSRNARSICRRSCNCRSGRPGPASPPDQQTALLTAFRRYTIANYVNSFDNYTGQRFDIQPDTKTLPNGEQVAQTKIVSVVGRIARTRLRHAPGRQRLEGGRCAGRRLDQPRRGAAVRLPPAGLARRRPGADREPEPEDQRPVGRRADRRALTPSRPAWPASRPRQAGAAAGR